MRRSPSSRTLRTAAIVGIAWTTSLVAPAVRAEADAPICEDASVNGQKLQRDGAKLIEARGQFRLCASPDCKQSRRDDCNAAIASLDERIPKVILEARRGDDAVSEAKVTVDGAPLVDHLDGRAIELDPGEHEFVFTIGAESVRVKKLILEAVPGQTVTATFAPPKTAEPERPAPAAPSPAPAPAVDPARNGSSQGTIGLVLGGMGIAAMGVGGLLGLSARSTANAANCPNNLCATQADVDQRASAVSRGNAATIVVGVGAAIAAGGVVVWLTAPHGTKSTGVTAVGLSPAGLVLGGRF